MRPGGLSLGIIVALAVAPAERARGTIAYQSVDALGNAEKARTLRRRR